MWVALEGNKQDVMVMMFLPGLQMVPFTAKLENRNISYKSVQGSYSPTLSNVCGKQGEVIYEDIWPDPHMNQE